MNWISQNQLKRLTCSDMVKKTMYNRIDKVHIAVYIHRNITLPGDTNQLQNDVIEI